MNTKKVALLILCLCSFAFAGRSQVLHYKNVTNDDVIYILNNTYKTIIFNNNTSDIFVHVYIVDDPSGSAHHENCEATNSIYFAVSEDGEAPRQYLYRLTSVYDPKIISWTKDAKIPSLTFSYGEAKKRKTATVLIYLDKLILKQTK
jgi:hypothetical protein